MITAMEAFYAFVGGLFIAGAGAFMLMLAFAQISARIAVWWEVMDAFKDRRDLQAEIAQLRVQLQTMQGIALGNAKTPDQGPNELVQTIVVDKMSRDGEG